MRETGMLHASRITHHASRITRHACLTFPPVEAAMKKHKMPEMKEGGVNVTPLIDIVMCLIIFFMLVAKIGVTSGADPHIKPPSTLLGAKIEDMGNTFTLNVR